MNVLVLGSGGREHALCQALKNSDKLSNLHCIPGNPGIAEIAYIHDLNPLDHQALFKFVKIHSIDLIIPGSEVYLESGVTDLFENESTVVFGPTKKATEIESSKVYAKHLMQHYNIPTASYKEFSDYQEAITYITNQEGPYVIKYSGLAGGKGVTVTPDLIVAKDTIKTMLKDKTFGSEKIIIEEFLEGEEFSFMCFVHEDVIIPMPIAQDHKPLLEEDKGPNTGGMGMISPVDSISQETISKAYTEIIQPTVKALMKENRSFTGFLYGGLIQTKEGPKVIEFNARFGDPEAEILLSKLNTDLLTLIQNLLKKKITPTLWDPDYYLGVVLASKGYPKKYEKNYEITGVDQLKTPYFHMGTKQANDTLKTNGGRVLLVLGFGQTFSEAKTKTYTEIKKIQCTNLQYRKDIGDKSQKEV
ncbi:MAG: phosphoribosylamine--glycine ligase [Candidatus Izimaplasma sp.]|nr:phosphoribosylamine--glycine ligase [Candidatus Izimaplasma bacterium]